MKSPRALPFLLAGIFSMNLGSSSAMGVEQVDPQPAIQKKTVPASQLTSLLNFLFSPALSTRDTLMVSQPDSIGLDINRKEGTGTL
jgi:hypothetical protein